MPVITLDHPGTTTGATPRSGLTRSRLRELALLASQRGLLSLAGGLPASELIPRTAYATALRDVLAADGAALQYGQPYEPLRERIVELLRERGVDCAPTDVLLTSGAQQALSLAAQLLMDPGDQVLMEEHVYAGLRQAVLPYRPAIPTVRTDLDTGMDVDGVRALLERGARPAFVYAIADTHNPCGVRLGHEQRARLVALARRFGVPIVEDDSYGLLHYDQDPLPALRALDPEWVIYVGTFSKIIAPALRLGWLVPAGAPRPHGRGSEGGGRPGVLGAHATRRDPTAAGGIRGPPRTHPRRLPAPAGHDARGASATTSPRARGGPTLPAASSCGWSCRGTSIATACARRRSPKPVWPSYRGPPSRRPHRRRRTTCG